MFYPGNQNDVHAYNVSDMPGLRDDGMCRTLNRMMVPGLYAVNVQKTQEEERWISKLPNHKTLPYCYRSNVHNGTVITMYNLALNPPCNWYDFYGADYRDVIWNFVWNSIAPNYPGLVPFWADCQFMIEKKLVCTPGDDPCYDIENAYHDYGIEYVCRFSIIPIVEVCF